MSFESILAASKLQPPKMPLLHLGTLMNEAKISLGQHDVIVQNALQGLEWTEQDETIYETIARFVSASIGDTFLDCAAHTSSVYATVPEIKAEYDIIQPKVKTLSRLVADLDKMVSKIVSAVQQTISLFRTLKQYDSDKIDGAFLAYSKKREALLKLATELTDYANGEIDFGGGVEDATRFETLATQKKLVEPSHYAAGEWETLSASVVVYSKKLPQSAKQLDFVTLDTRSSYALFDATLVVVSGKTRKDTLASAKAELLGEGLTVLSYPFAQEREVFEGAVLYLALPHAKATLVESHLGEVTGWSPLVAAK